MRSEVYGEEHGGAAGNGGEVGPRHGPFQCMLGSFHLCAGWYQGIQGVGEDSMVASTRGQQTTV